ncbi:MAG: 3D-(3,5/4)-trihydroxycyclohexane-1,2-dione acylhydrolase (decyclizing) [SAR324 cluster bacterium]|uniref:3D-(3,5/4)-trihydroxycyclohexane-1,2-dione acylhydrolase (Decyclizing) n=1 Tax=SAR324 cluster bacterium TaxID=2024889 RepID=A0A2D6YN41_9DELT|nr:3D-(3,5/4)-trihydroxycyclohexane-1,2-dione acylhydrolase (decyclizing) [SAR324 cluster bacterium]
MKTIRLTMAQALVRYLINQHTMIDSKQEPLFPGVFAIFGHGNVTCLGEALESVRHVMPTWRGQNEQSMGLAAVAFAKARRRRQIMVATSSIGPGCTNFLTAAGTAHSNRLPVLFLSGDTFSNRLPDPVLQQVEHFQDPTMTVADAFKSCTRFWDRITHPAQLMVSLPQAIAAMMNPATSGPTFIALPQDIQAVAYDYPEVFFDKKIHRSPRPRPDQDSIAEAAAILKSAQQPMIVSGGGVFYSDAVATLTSFAEKHGIPVTETIAGRSQMLHDHKLNAGPLGVIGSSSANAIAAEADVVLAVGTRLQDFTTGSWSVFGNESMRLIAINAASFDAHKHRALSVVGDAKVSLEDLSSALGNWAGSPDWLETAQGHYAEWNRTVDEHSGPSDAVPPSYGQVVGAINRICDTTDLALTAAGGLPGELCKNWKTRSIGTFDCEFGFSCMGYEIAGGWGAKLADPSRDVIVFVGDGSYLMLNSDIYSTVLTGHKMIVIVCDNGGFSVINRLQNFKGSASFNNLLQDCKVENLQKVNFVQHATSMGALGEQVESTAELEAAFKRAKAADRTYVICIKTQPSQWTPGDAWWDVGVPEVSDREEVRQARSDHSEGQRRQRLGV